MSRPQDLEPLPQRDAPLVVRDHTEHRRTLLPLIVSSFERHVQWLEQQSGELRPSAHPGGAYLNDLLAPNEPLKILVQAQDHGSKKPRFGFGKVQDVLLVGTDRRFLCINTNGDVYEEHALGSMRSRELVENHWTGQTLTVEASGTPRVFCYMRPPDHGVQLAGLLGAPLDGKAVSEHSPDTPPIAHFGGDAVLFEDRLVTWPQQFPMSHGVEAVVDSAGNIAVTRGRDLGAKAVGGLLTGGLGLFMFGNAREQMHDMREHYLFVDGPDWAYSGSAAGDLGQHAREFAQAVNLVARLHPKPALGADDRSESETVDPVAQLERLVALRDQGALTDEEFKAAKARVVRSERSGA